jgi:hypothetical protein
VLALFLNGKPILGSIFVELKIITVINLERIAGIAQLLQADPSDPLTATRAGQ